MLFKQSHTRHVQFIYQYKIRSSSDLINKDLFIALSSKSPVKLDANSFANFYVVSSNYNSHNEFHYLFLPFGIVCGGGLWPPFTRGAASNC
jgi:hypothetical protein